MGAYVDKGAASLYFLIGKASPAGDSPPSQPCGVYAVDPAKFPLPDFFFQTAYTPAMS